MRVPPLVKSIYSLVGTPAISPLMVRLAFGEIVIRKGLVASVNAILEAIVGDPPVTTMDGRNIPPAIILRVFGPLRVYPGVKELSTMRLILSFPFRTIGEFVPILNDT
jgi:hypothetical protein